MRGEMILEEGFLRDWMGDLMVGFACVGERERERVGEYRPLRGLVRGTSRE